MRFIVAATLAGLSMAAPIAQEPAAVQSLQLQAPPAPAPPATYAPPAQAPGMPSAAAIAFANDPARGAMAGIYDFWAGQAKNFQNWQAAAAADWAKNGAAYTAAYNKGKADWWASTIGGWQAAVDYWSTDAKKGAAAADAYAAAHPIGTPAYAPAAAAAPAPAYAPAPAPAH